MKKEDYKIPFRGLGAGAHAFGFEIDEEFFKGEDLLDVKKGAASVSVDMIKEATLMDLHFRLKGTLRLVCERCLSEYDQPFEGEFRLIVKFGETFDEESDEVVTIPRTESNLNVGGYIYEYVNLLLPIKKAHEHIEDCDQEMIGKIEAHEQQNADPRWDALKKLKLK